MIQQKEQEIVVVRKKMDELERRKERIMMAVEDQQDISQNQTYDTIIGDRPYVGGSDWFEDFLEAYYVSDICINGYYFLNISSELSNKLMKIGLKKLHDFLKEKTGHRLTNIHKGCAERTKETIYRLFFTKTLNKVTNSVMSGLLHLAKVKHTHMVRDDPEGTATREEVILSRKGLINSRNNTLGQTILGHELQIEKYRKDIQEREEKVRQAREAIQERERPLREQTREKMRQEAEGRAERDKALAEASVIENVCLACDTPTQMKMECCGTSACSVCWETSGGKYCWVCKVIGKTYNNAKETRLIKT
jgi:hypothetical protein